MENEERRPQLVMRRPDLKDLAPVNPPEGYRVRAWRPGEGAAWSAVICAAFGREYDRDKFDRQMRRDCAFRPERVLFVECEAGPVATASAWWSPKWGKRTGYLHMVGTHPEYQGRGLGRTVSLAALHQCVRDGRECAVLETDDFRLAAVKMYLRLGFQPVLVHENQRDRWRAIFDTLRQPDLAEEFREILAGPLSQPETESRDEWPIETLPVRWVWLPGRISHKKPSRSGTVDCLGDESLYRASDLGQAGVDPCEVRAAEDRPFTLWFRAGPAELAPGTTVRYCVHGQRVLGHRLQITDAEEPGFVEVTGPEHVALEPLAAGFRVKEGALREGDEVLLHVGRRGGFRWTPLAGRREWKVIIARHPDEPEARLPEPVIVDVLPLEPDRLDVLVPGTAARGQVISGCVSVRDRFDNRVPLSDTATIHLGDETCKAPLVNGYAEVPMRMPDAAVARAVARCGVLPHESVSNPCVCGKPMQVYFGDLHCHDFLSAAEGYPDQVYRWAKEDKRLDFVSVSIQSHGYHDNEKWAIVKCMNERFLEEGRFVTFLAFEWQHSHFGDKVVHYLGGDQPYLPVDDPRYGTPAKLYEALRSSDALVIGHHPSYPRDVHVPGTDYSAVETDVERLCEIWSMHGSSEGYEPDDRPLVHVDPRNTVLCALKSGLRVGLVAGSDTHSARPCGSAREPRPYWGGLCAVWAESLTRRSVFDALRARRTYALTGARIVMEMTVNGSPMGSEIPPAKDVEVILEVHAPGEIASVELLKDGDVLREDRPRGALDYRIALDEHTGPEGRAFYHARVRQRDGHLAVCSPVWVG